ncbi:MAG: protein kinase domain-containing protein [Longimicrobiales bacterium]
MQSQPENPGAPSVSSDDLERRLRDELAPGLEVLRLIGRGATAGVYLARESALRRLVAVKVLSAEVARDPVARQRFEREGQAAAAIVHPNVVTVYRVDRLADDTPFLVMQYVKGPSLAERIAAEGPLPVPEVRRLLVALASALAAAHQHHVIHRDIRPANVLCEEGSDRVLLTDFGLAYIQTTGAESLPRLTRTGIVLGDPAHVSPEQALGAAVTDRTDIYSLGLLGYELLTGTPPVAEPRAGAGVVHGDPPDLLELRHDVDPDLADLLRRCLARTAAHRPPAAELARRLAAPAPGVGTETAPALTRLTAVLFVDIVGYSAISATDERAALEHVGRLQQVVREQTDRLRGRLVKFVGDAALVHFSSTESAVRAGLAIMERFADSSSGGRTPPELRIGIHAGDVTTASDGDLYGDGVNTAARLQTEARPGQILVSGDVWRQLRARPEYAFRVIGEKRLRGLQGTVQLVEVRPAAGAEHVSGVRGLIAELRRRHVFRVMLVYGAVAFIVLQVAERTLEPLGLPDWTYGLVLLLILLGFPLAVVLAWAYDLGPRGLERTAPRR